MLMSIEQFESINRVLSVNERILNGYSNDKFDFCDVCESEHTNVMEIEGLPTMCAICYEAIKQGLSRDRADFVITEVTLLAARRYLKEFNSEHFDKMRLDEITDVGAVATTTGTVGAGDLAVQSGNIPLAKIVKKNKDVEVVKPTTGGDVIEKVDIDVKNEGILEVPDGKKVTELGLDHFVKLVKKNGYEKIARALTNLEVWNKNDDPEISKWAKDMRESLKKEIKG